MASMACEKLAPSPCKVSVVSQRPRPPADPGAAVSAAITATVVMASFQPITHGKSKTTFTECRLSQVSKTIGPITIRINKESN